jgi:hypothetical protein
VFAHGRRSEYMSTERLPLSLDFLEPFAHRGRKPGLCMCLRCVWRLLEETRLLEKAGEDLADLITAAIETGMRLGELLSLQWHQVWLSPRELFLPAGKTKARKDRRVPISKPLLAVLQRRRLDPAGEPLPSDAFVFGDAVGRRRRSIKTAWRLTCQRAGIVGLHFHDLRREAGSWWRDSGEVPSPTFNDGSATSTSAKRAHIFRRLRGTIKRRCDGSIRRWAGWKPLRTCQGRHCHKLPQTPVRTYQIRSHPTSAHLKILNQT